MPGKFSKKRVRSRLPFWNYGTLCDAYRKLALSFVLLGLVCVGNPAAIAQEIGFRPVVAPEPVELGFVENAVGDLHLEIPLGAFPQRGTKVPMVYRYSYDSGIWTVDPIHNVWMTNPFFATLQGGWQLVSTSALEVSYSTQNSSCGPSYFDFLWVDASGTKHEFPITTGYCQTQNFPNGDAFAADSSGYHMYVTDYTNAKVYGPDGTLVCVSPVITDSNNHYIDSEDSNGNFHTQTYDDQMPPGFFDTTGRLSLQSGGTVLAALNSQGQYSQYGVTFVSIPVKTAFGQPGVTEFSGSITVIQSITLPSGASYTFKYDCDSGTGNAACGSPSGQSGYYGVLTSLTLPTGGTISYGYLTFSDSYGTRSRWLNSRTSANGTWTYTPQVISTCTSTQVGCQQKVTATKPSGASTVYTFTLNNGAWPTQVKTSNSSGSLLSTITNSYDFSVNCPFNYSFSPCYGAGYVRLLTTQVTLPVPSGSTTKQTQYAYDSPQTGNITAVKQWAYYPGTSPSFPSVSDRATYTTYASIGTNDIDKPLSVTVCNNSGSNSACPGGGSIVAQTLYTYDSYGANCPYNGLQSVTGVSNHDDTNFGSAYTTRGNLTYVKQWAAGSTYLTTQYCYDTTGQITEKFDPAGNSTLYGYADNYFNDNGSNPPASYTQLQATNAYVTSITSPIGTKHLGYYYGSGKRALLTDENGATTYDHYMDSLDRPTSVIFPTGWNLETYPSATELDLYVGVGDASPSTGCGSCQRKSIFLDSWDREYQRTLDNAPGGAINVETKYDTDGRVSSVSYPSTGPSYVYENYYYDGLDRQIEVVHPNNQNSQTVYGASVANGGGLTSQQGSPSTYGYGYPVLMDDEDGKQKQEWLDGFGRIIEVDESTTSGTPGKGSATIDGFEQKQCSTSAPVKVTSTTSAPTIGCPIGQGYIFDSGDVSITVGGFTADAGYGQGSTASSIANALTSQLNASTSPVTATLSGTTISLTSKATGGQADYSLSTSTSWDDTDFSSPSFTATLSGSTLTGGSGLLNPVATLYKYDALGNLTQVVQGSQTRTFTYDGLSRKTSENTPESGTVSFSFTVSGGGLCSGGPGNPCSKTDARGITTTYTYDALNRITAKSYSNGQGSVTYSYDQGGAGAFALGRLTQMTDPSGSETYTYYADGHVKTLQKVIGSSSYTISYQYNPGGELTQITYPSGRVLQYGYDNVGWLCAVAPSTSGCTATNPYASAYTYDSAGHVTGFTYGNGIFATYGFSPTTEQMNCLDYSTTNRNGSCTHDSTTKFGLNYYYQQDSTNCPNGTTGDDGLIQCITDAVDSGRTVGYAYDGVNRLISGATNGSTNYPKWGLAWTYDQWGNRLSESVTAGSGPSSSLSFNSHNQPTGYSYDASGNMTNEPGVGCNYSYDADNRLVSVSSCASASYTYDANGLRVKKLATGTTTVSVYSGSKVIAEYDNGAAPSSPSREYVYGRGQFLAMLSGTTTTYYQQDHLSVRMATNSSGGVAWQAATYPYGEPWYTSNGTPEFFFTTYQRDQETGLDYALARYYNSRTGGFCSADPVEGTPSDPETWNRYVYARDNPVNLTDPSGQGFWSWLLGFIVGLILFAITGNPALLARVGILGTIMIPIAGPFPGSTPTTLPGSSPTITWQDIAIPGYRNVKPTPTFFPNDIQLAADNLDPIQKTGNCVQSGLAATFSSASGVSQGSGLPSEVGGHYNYPEVLTFPSEDAMNQFQFTYNSDSEGGVPPAARFGSGLHVENPGSPQLTDAGSTINVTAHLDLYNPNNSLYGLGSDAGIRGLVGHVLIDGAWGHIVQWSGKYLHLGPGSIDQKNCPYPE